MVPLCYNIFVIKRKPRKGKQVMNDKRYFDIIRKTEIAQLIEVLQLFEEYLAKGIENEFADVLRQWIKEKVAERSKH